jgi:hypothetical protein
MQRITSISRTVMSVVGRNVLAFVIFWFLGLVLVQFGQRAIGGWLAPSLGQTLSCVAGAGIALALRARVTALLAAGFAAYSVSELIAHSYYGIRAVQGAPAHFAVMGAGILGVGIGALLVSRQARGGLLNS